MTRTLSIFLLASVLLKACPALAAIESPLRTEILVIQNGQVIDGIGRNPMTNANLVIEAGKIAAGGSSDEGDIPPGARRIDARGKSIIRGLIDMHVHYQD